MSLLGPDNAGLKIRLLVKSPDILSKATRVPGLAFTPERRLYQKPCLRVSGFQRRSLALCERQPILQVLK